MLLKGQILTVLAVAAMMLSPKGADAHHSFAMFDREKTVKVQAVVKELQWTNPHIWLNVMILNDQGVPEEWGFESGPTATLKRAGWTRDLLKPGDKIGITMNPMKDGSHAGNLVNVTLADGTVYGLGIQGTKPEEGETLPEDAPPAKQ
jgi:hypothetical protein